MHLATLEDADVIYLEELLPRLAGIPALIPTALSLLRDAHAHLRVHVTHMEPEGAPHLHGRTPRKQPPPRRPGLPGRPPSGDLTLQQGLRIGPRLMVGEKLPAQWAEDRDYTLGAFRKDTGALVGSYCLTLISRGVWELGYWAVKEQRGRGYSVEAAQALCDWGWGTLDVHRIEWWAMAGNTGSRAVAEKLGFTVEGTLRNRGIANDGKPHDWRVGGLLRP
ncbi:GNAT family N-acetyltransferase [Streptomyces violascens]|uniref:GNAT family N-acetyltransferase n=1 Tax=Streptomyces violascens TaxID=67381 RepID=UPI0036673F8C